MEYGRFFFYYEIKDAATNTKHKRKSISSGYIIPKIIFNKKKCSKLLETQEIAQNPV